MPRRKNVDNLYNRPLCFTTSSNRPYMLYSCINSVLNQSFKDFNYYVNINITNDQEKDLYNKLLSDFITDTRLSIIYSENKTQHENYLKPIIEAGRDKYNVFIKIDDDDIYKTNYIKNVLTLYKKHKKDILSCSLKYTINGKEILQGVFDSIGQWEGDQNSDIKFGMPCTYVMNQSAVNVLLKMTPQYVRSIHMFEDPAWRTEWRKAGLKSVVIKNFEDAVYNIHGKNTSSSYLYKDTNSITYIENDYFFLSMVKHKWWQSYHYFNKRNNRMYNINNDDHGAYLLSGNELKIMWDSWGEETFIKKSDNNTIYFELK